MLEQETNIIAMLKTGEGKLMVVILPALIETDTAVVIVLPLKFLVTNWKKKLKAMEVPFQIYNDSRPLLTNINLILVSADKARFKTWRQYLTEFNEVLLATRMVFDEAHLTLLSEEFRVSLQDVHKLRQFPMQLVLLMAIMPHSSILALKHMFGLLSTAIEIRELINCPKLEYIMRQPAQSNTLESKAIQIVVQERQQWTSEDRGLVFVTYMKNSKSLSERTTIDRLTGRSTMDRRTRAMPPEPSTARTGVQERV
ncbi:hypothetical protein EDD22DRAFT_954216 [Suillus occidentalis]|nr:hypothetical protein EDD22DRAFT_954216 [Suillus occidentalis]